MVATSTRNTRHERPKEFEVILSSDARVDIVAVLLNQLIEPLRTYGTDL
jgi:hypothetical protein